MLDYINPTKLWKEKKEPEEKIKNFVVPQNNDGAKENYVDPSSAFVQVDFNNNKELTSTKQLIREYRRIAKVPEVEDAIQNIVDQAIVTDETDQSAWVDLDSTEFSESVKKRIIDEFENVKKILDYKNKARTYFYNWYVDSRLYVQKVYDKQRKKLLKIQFIEPTDVQFVREIHTQTQGTGEVLITGIDEYYIYYQTFSNNGSNYIQTGSSYDSINGARIKIPKDDIVYVPSGDLDRNSANHNSVIGYLDRAIKPVNNLKLLEDSLVVYRLARAPERRVFYIDTGQMNSRKANQYVRSIINSTKNRVVYDSSTGKIKNSNANMSMLEDYYLPRREGSKGTEISPLQGGQTLGQIDDIEYFNRKIYKVLHIPASRAREESGSADIDFGQGSSISRDELNFEKFVLKLLNQYAVLLYGLLKEYVVDLDKVITEEEWNENFDNINIKFPRDSAFEEQVKLDKLNARVTILNEMDQYVGKYFPKKWIYNNVLDWTDDDIKENEIQMGKEQLIIPSDAQPAVIYAVNDEYRKVLEDVYKQAEKDQQEIDNEVETAQMKAQAQAKEMGNPFEKKDDSNKK